MKITWEKLSYLCALMITQSLMCATNNKTFLSYTPENTVPRSSLGSLDTFNQNHNLHLQYAYFHSYDYSKLRSYFFPYAKQQLIFGDRDSTDNPNRNNADVDYRFFINIDDAGSRSVTLHMKPEQQIHYVSADYYHAFCACNTPFFFMLHVPFVHVSNRLNPSFIPQDFTSDENPTDLEHFFAGTFENTNARHQQARLQALTFTNDKHTSSGIADISILVGWHIVQEPTFRASLATGVVLPSSNKPKGRVLFEPLRGNNGHWGITLHSECTKQLWSREDFAFEVNVMNDLLYLIPNNQTRTVGIKHIPWGHYVLLGKKGAINEPLFPSANILTCNMRINPGIQASSMVTTTLITPCIDVGIGYSLLIKGEEGVGLKNPFPEETYGIAAFGHDTSTEFTQATTRDGHWLRSQDIDVSVAQTPSQVIHGVHCALTKIIELNKVALKANGGVQTSFTPQNTAPVGYTLWAMLGVFF